MSAFNSLKDLYGDAAVRSILRLDPKHEVGVRTTSGPDGFLQEVLLLTQMRDGSFEVCTEPDPIRLLQTVLTRRGEIDIADNVLGILFAVLFNDFYVKTN